MATDKFVPGDLVLVDFPGSGYWPCQVSRIMSKNWRKVEYFGGGEEIGKAHVQVIRDYDEATKDDLEEFIPKIKMDEDPILRQAVKQINQKFTGKKMKMRGVKKGTRNETKKMSDKKETGGKQKLEKTSEKKEGTGGYIFVDNISKMKTGPPKVITLDSDSEDELQVVSENISNYGNFSTPVEIAPELQEKLRISLEKSGNLPGKIKAIKVYATKRNSEMSSVRASFQPSNGQPSTTINVGPSINAIFSSGAFSNRVQGGGNNNSIKGNTATALEKPNQVPPSPQPSLKRSHRPMPDGVNPRITQRSSTPSSPVILYSPIRKRKTPKPRYSSGRAFPSRDFQQTFAAPPTDTHQQTPLIRRRKTNSEQFDAENVVKARDLSLNDLELNTSDMMFKNVWPGVNSNANPVNLSPMRFSSDDEQFVDDSILAIWDSPVPSPRSPVEPFKTFEEAVPILRENNTKCTENVIESTKDLDGEEKTLQNMILKNAESEDFVSETGEKLKGCNIISKQFNVFEKESRISTEKEHNFANLANQVEQEQSGKGERILDNETEIIIDVNIDKQCDSFESKKQYYSDYIPMSKSVKINAKTRSKRLLGSSVKNRGNEEQSFLNASVDQDKTPPLWTTIFPPSPPSPPPQSWMNSGALYDLNASDFLAIAGLCRLETAKQIKRNLNAPKPLIRVLRKRQKK